MKTLISAGVLAMMLAAPAFAGPSDPSNANQTIQQPVQDRVTGEDVTRTGTKADNTLKSGSDMGKTTRAISGDTSMQSERPAKTDQMTGGLNPEKKRTY